MTSPDDELVTRVAEAVKYRVEWDDLMDDELSLVQARAAIAVVHQAQMQAAASGDWSPEVMQFIAAFDADFRVVGRKEPAP